MNGNMDELDEKEKEQRKKDQIAYRKKQSTSNLFLLFGTIIEIVISLVMVFAYFLLVTFICYRVLHLTEDVIAIIFNILLIIAFIGGLATGFFIYRRLGRLVIKKFKLEENLREDVLNQFKTRKEYEETVKNKKTR